MVQARHEAATGVIPGHHSGDSRNVGDGQGVGRHDIFSAAVRMTRMPRCLANPNQPDLPVVFVNEAFQQMTGYREAEILGRNCRFLQGPDTDPEVVHRIGQAIRAREDLAVELINYKRNGTPFWNADAAPPPASPATPASPPACPRSVSPHPIPTAPTSHDLGSRPASMPGTGRP
jgi:PAS domain-containing protein